MSHGYFNVAKIISFKSILLVFGLFTLLSLTTVSADSGAWTRDATADIRDLESNIGGRVANSVNPCINQYVEVEGYSGVYKGCLYSTLSLRIGQVELCEQVAGKCSYKPKTIIQLRGENTAHVLNGFNVDNNCFHTSKYSDNVVTNCLGYLNIYRHFMDFIDLNDKGGVISYNFTNSGLVRTIKLPSNQNRAVSAVNMSESGEWLVAEMRSDDLFRVNLETLDTRLFTNKVRLYGYGMDPDYELAISNDGNYAVSAGRNIGIQAYNIQGSCGYNLNLESGTWRFVYDDRTFKNCESISLEGLNYSIDGDKVSLSNAYFPRFNSLGNQIEFVATIKIANDLINYQVVVTMNGVNPYSIPDSFTNHIDYLALGDSYSSGEGDIDDDRAYYTDNSKDGCHVSIRSYPFLLADHWTFTSMNSVACSGALVSKDYVSDRATYGGQHGELTDLDSVSALDTKQAALVDFRPGIVPQIEFVKRYQPRVITITGGGNDVDFGKVIENCAGDATDTTFHKDCAYVEGGSLHDVLNDNIDSQYTKILDMILQIKQVSPDSLIYYVGYPSFISTNTICAFNSGFLSQAERLMIDDALKRLNGVIETASSNAGASYINVEQALYGGRLCEGSEFVTGVWDANFINTVMGHTPSEVFHPNALGHQMIYKAIMSQTSNPFTDFTLSLAKDPVQPNFVTDYYDLVEGDTISQGSVASIYVPIDTSGATVGVALHSDDYAYTFESTGDGLEFLVPNNIDEGRYVLVVEVASSAGKYRYIQTINVAKSYEAKSVDIGGNDSDNADSSNANVAQDGDSDEGSVGDGMPDGIVDEETNVSNDEGDDSNETSNSELSETDDSADQPTIDTPVDTAIEIPVPVIISPPEIPTPESDNKILDDSDDTTSNLVTDMIDTSPLINLDGSTTNQVAYTGTLSDIELSDDDLDTKGALPEQSVLGVMSSENESTTRLLSDEDVPYLVTITIMIVVCLVVLAVRKRKTL